jgi:hypothetical protein
MPTARFWRKWLRLGEWWLRRRIRRISSQPIAFRQHRFRVLPPDEATLVPCVAAQTVRKARAPSTFHSFSLPQKRTSGFARSPANQLALLFVFGPVDLAASKAAIENIN